MNSKDVHKITRDQIEHILKYLRFTDGARNELAGKEADIAPLSQNLREAQAGSTAS